MPLSITVDLFNLSVYLNYLQSRFIIFKISLFDVSIIKSNVLYIVAVIKDSFIAEHFVKLM